MNNEIDNKLSAGAIAFCSIFLIIGLIMLKFAISTFSDKIEFKRTGIITQGEVVELASSRGDRSGYMYTPIIAFLADGKSYQFQHSASSNPPMYDIGEKVEVIYWPESPSKASLNTFWGFWGPPIFISIAAVVFTLVGGGLIYGMVARYNTRKNLISNGQRITAKLDCVDKVARDKGRDYWVVRANWQNPADGKIYLFESDQLYYNPETYISSSQQISVLIEPNNPKKYIVDLSSMPKTA